MQQNLSITLTHLDSFNCSFIPKSLNPWNNLDISVCQSASIGNIKDKISSVGNIKEYFYYEVSHWAVVQHANKMHMCNNLHEVEQSCVCRQNHTVSFSLLCGMYPTIMPFVIALL